MQTPEQIASIAKAEKELIWKHHFGSLFLRRKSLSLLQKHEKNALLLLGIEYPAELCIFLGVPFPELERIINYPEYRHYSIGKKKTGEREISAPSSELKKIQKRLNYFLQAYYLMIKPAEVHGFVANPHYLPTKCNIIENAKVHVAKRHVLNIDLKDFFPGITAKRVKDLFTSGLFGYNDQIANSLTLLATLNGRLPTGAPTSPVISNFICFQLDQDLIKFCKINNLYYTRYADDLTFSSNNFISDDHVLDIILVIEKNHFKINEKKLRLKTNNRRQVVTGLTVNEKVNVNRKLLKKTRAMLHDLSVNGPYAAAGKHFSLDGAISERTILKFMHQLGGYINFVGQVRSRDDKNYIRMTREFKAISKAVKWS